MDGSEGSCRCQRLPLDSNGRIHHVKVVLYKVGEVRAFLDWKEKGQVREGKGERAGDVLSDRLASVSRRGEMRAVRQA